MGSDLLAYIYEELNYFQNEWKHDISDIAIRRGSTSLRSLLHEDKLQLAWKEVGFEKQPRILATSLDYININDPLYDFSFMQAGGAKTFGAEIKNAAVYNRALSDKEIKELYNKEKNEIEQKPISLSEFKKSTCIIINKIKISREEVILYVGNKLGGSHFDEKRNIEKTIEAKFFIMDNYRKMIKIGNRDPIYLELLSIVHYIQQSQDIHKLRKIIKDLLVL